MKRSEWTYKKAQVNDIHGSLTPRTELVHPVTGAKWGYVPASLDARMTIGGDDECWLDWKGSWHRQGFPMLPVKRENDTGKSNMMNVQRLVMAIELGRPLLKEERVYATCKSVACLNPAHLKIGDRADCRINKEDSYMKKWPWEFIDQHLHILLNEPRSVIKEVLDCSAHQASNLKSKAKKRQQFLQIQAQISKKKA